MGRTYVTVRLARERRSTVAQVASLIVAKVRNLLQMLFETSQSCDHLDVCAWDQRLPLDQGPCRALTELYHHGFARPTIGMVVQPSVQEQALKTCHWELDVLRK